MTLPLFAPEPAAEARRVSLVRLAGEIARSVAAVGLVAVDGEVHRPTTSKGGWVFFTLRDRAAQVDVKIPRANLRRCRVADGERVRVVGVLEWSPERGQLGLRAIEVAPIGAGAIAALLAETRARLGADGLLARPRRRLPLLPVCVGVVCGADAAVRKDIESVVEARFPGYPLVFEETTVSGPAAVGSIVAGLARVAACSQVEVVILARGGGDPTSLLPWSDEEVCRAVATCPVAVVSAIGHEGDRPLCDEVADLRCGTPSMAAAAVVPSRAELDARLATLALASGGHLDRRLTAAAAGLRGADTGRALEAGLLGATAGLAAAGRRLGDTHPRVRLDACRRTLAGADWRRPSAELFGRAAGRLEADRRHLAALDPSRVLERGYAVVSGPDGNVLRSSGDLAVGDRVRVRLAEGRFTARVEHLGRDSDLG